MSTGCYRLVNGHRKFDATREEIREPDSPQMTKPYATPAADWQITANSYKTISANQGLEITEDEYETLKTALQAANQDGAYGQFGQWGLDRCDGKVHVFAKFSERWWLDLPCDFLRLLGSLIAKNGLTYLEFFKTFTCDELRMCNNDGKYFRVKSDGSVWELKLTWVRARAIPKVREPHFEKQGDSEAGKQLPPLQAGTKNPETGTPKTLQSQRAITSRQKRPANGHVVRNGHVLPRVMAAVDWSHRGLHVTSDGDGHRNFLH